MSDHYSFPNHEVLRPLRDARIRLEEPFSRSNLRQPVAKLCEAVGLLHTHLIHEREHTGIDDEDVAAIRRIEKKLQATRERDLELRRKQDLILRCLHPDGCYRGYLSKEVKREAYRLAGVDPVEGVAGLRLGWPSPEIDAVHEFLAGHVRKLEEEDWRRTRW